MQIFVQQLLPQEWRGREAMSTQQTQAANNFPFMHVLQEGARK